MKSQASDTTLVGGGSRAPDSEQRSCHTNSDTEITMSGGRMTCMAWRATSPMRSGQAALAAGTARSRPWRLARGWNLRPTWWLRLPASRHLLDLEGGEIGLRIGRIEHLAVEER